ncbi:MAG: hydroxymyristoyl-ACP dehydratase [Balneola sp.]|nr:MAG: hydroxymyristoyl-ACP dehydratase [Balneola sp.]
MSLEDRILSLLPQKHPFRFVDKILEVNDDTITGEYTFKKDEYFYAGHFEGNPVTPGVILTECCAQVALVCHSIFFLLKEDPEAKNKYIQWFSNSEATFLKPVYPGETVTVSGKKSYFRHGKFKSEVKMVNKAGEVVCRATLSGMGFIEKENID